MGCRGGGGVALSRNGDQALGITAIASIETSKPWGNRTLAGAGRSSLDTAWRVIAAPVVGMVRGGHRGELVAQVFRRTRKYLSDESGWSRSRICGSWKRESSLTTTAWPFRAPTHHARGDTTAVPGGGTSAWGRAP